uniref:hypothetical protein n=1 Tax=Escherichia coli TaxID=562 RepID=UPI001F3E29C7|nr:hypothetical protein [Escherichia coli]
MIQGQAVEAACQPARKPLAGWRLPEGKRATLARRPLPFPFVMCPECFFLMLCFCGYRAVTVLLLFPLPLLSVPLLFMAFPGVPLAGRAVVNGASEAVSALAGFHP